MLNERAAALIRGDNTYNGRIHKCGETFRFVSNRRCVRCEPLRKLHERFGLTREIYEDINTRQHHRCAVCNTSWSETITPVVDHDHTTKRVRGLLCHKCNRGLGLFKDRIDLLQSIVRYLKV